MRLHRIPCPSPLPISVRTAVTLVRVGQSLAVCVVCGHEERGDGRERFTCPDCGSTGWSRRSRGEAPR